MTAGDRLRAARLNAGYKSVAKAAAALGMSESSYRAHENGQNAFTADQAEKYAQAFGSDAGWLMFGDDLSGPEITTGAVALSSSAILAALVQSLHDKGVLSGEETVEVYEQALLLLEMQQAKADESPAYGQVVATARELIEQHLRPA
jgi:transcriptional regulator with XRE-family HTH domain